MLSYLENRKQEFEDYSLTNSKDDSELSGEEFKRKENFEKDFFKATIEEFIQMINLKVSENGFILPGKKIIQIEGNYSDLIRDHYSISIFGLEKYRLLKIKSKLSTIEKIDLLLDYENVILQHAFVWGKALSDYHKKCEQLFNDVKEQFIKEAKDNVWVFYPQKLIFDYYQSPEVNSFTFNISLKYNNDVIHILRLENYKEDIMADFTVDHYISDLYLWLKGYTIENSY